MGEGPRGFPVTRRHLLRMIGTSAGSAVMYQAMTSLGLAAETSFTAPPALGAAPPGASVLILGAGIAGLVSAYELRKAGYKVQVLEYNGRAGGRNMSLRGGDTYTELGGATQHCQFDPGLYINPGPWRLPHHHAGILHYCKLLKVPVENFVQVNHHAYLHSDKAFGGKPQRYRTIKADYQGHVAELLAKSARGGKIDAPLEKDDLEKLLGSLQYWGALDQDYKYVAGEASSDRRGFAADPGGGLSGRPKFSEPVGLHDMLDAGLWSFLPNGANYDMQSTMMQPVGGMGRIGEAFGRELAGLIHYNAKVVDIRQDASGVSVSYVDSRTPGQPQVAKADWCVCTIPLSILSQIPMQVGEPMRDAIGAVPYAASVKVGLQFKRRFWEEDEAIYGGVTYTSLPIGQISYPSSGYHGDGKAVLLGAYIWGPPATEFTAMSPDERVREAVRQGAQIHPQYLKEFDNGISLAWHRSPFTLGCFGLWSDEAREKHYDALCAFDGRIVLAGEHASYLPAWQEGAVTSAMDAIGRLHQRAHAGARA